MSGYEGKYKIGDIVRLRSDLVVGKVYGCNDFVDEMKGYVGHPLEIVDIHNFGYEVEMNGVVRDYDITDEMIEGLWKEKHVAQIIFEAMNNNDNFPKKIKLINVLNKIANGELKEGTKVKFEGKEYMYAEVKGIFDLYCCYENCESYEYMHDTIFDDYHIDILNDEVELIEP